MGLNMTYVRVVLGGAIFGAQRWSVGHTVQLAGPGFPSGAEMSTFAESCFAAFKAQVWNGSASGKLQGENLQTVTLDSARTYSYADAGGTAVTVGASTGAAVAGSQTQNASAPQIALVATLENGLAGRRNRGRMYLPVTCGITGGVPTLTQAAALAHATSVANYLSAVRILTIAGTSVSVVVSSLTATSPITAVSVDTVLDTQRRRRDKITGSRGRASLIVG